MKVIKQDGKIMIFIDETKGNGQEMINKYVESGKYDIVEAIPCSMQDKCSCHKVAYIEKVKK